MAPSDSGSSSAEAAPDQTHALVFVPLTAADAAAGRKPSSTTVRQHISRLQHARSRKRKPMQDLQTWTVAPSTSRRGRAQSQSSGKSNDTTTTPSSSSRSDETPDESPPLAVFLGSTAKEDPFWTFPVSYESNLPQIIAHYIENLAVNIPDLDGCNQTGLLRRSWFPLAMTQPSTMYAVLLLAAAHFYAVTPAHNQKLILLHLKARALNEINTAISQPSAPVTDALIGAVMKMGAYEAIFGDPLVYTAHMQGLSLMLRRRGGPKSLGLDGLLERMVVWIDTNAAHLTGTKRVTGGEDLPSDFECDGTDVSLFTGLS